MGNKERLVKKIDDLLSEANHNLDKVFYRKYQDIIANWKICSAILNILIIVFVAFPFLSLSMLSLKQLHDHLIFVMAMVAMFWCGITVASLAVLAEWLFGLWRMEPIFTGRQNILGLRYRWTFHAPGVFDPSRRFTAIR